MIYKNRKAIIAENMEQYISEIFSYWPLKKEYYSLISLKLKKELQWIPTLSTLLKYKSCLEQADNSALKTLNSVLDSYTIFSKNLKKYKNDWYNLLLLSYPDIKWALREYKEKYFENVEDLISHVLEIFIKTKWTWDTGFLYQNAWVGLYDQIKEEPCYSEIIKEWIGIIGKYREEIRKLLPEGTILVDFGCCDWKKALALLDGIGQDITYLPVDVNEEELTSAIGTIKNLEIDKKDTTKKIKILKWIINTWKITNPIKSIVDDNMNDYTYLFTWWSIWNYSDDDIKTLFSKTFKPKKWGIVFDYYKAPTSIAEIEALLKCYDNEETKNRFKSWLKNLHLARNYWETATKRWNNIGADLTIGLNFDDFFKFSVRYEFSSLSWDKYYAELYDNKVKIYKYDWTWPLKTSQFQEKIYPWKIIEWFKVLKDTSQQHYIFNPYRYGELSKQGALPSEQQIAFSLHWKDLFNYFKDEYSQYDDNDWHHWLIPNKYAKEPKKYQEKHVDEYVWYYELDEEDRRIYRYFPKILDDKLNKSGQIFHVENNVNWGWSVPINRKKNEFIPIEISRRFSDKQIESFLIDAWWPKEKIKILWWNAENFMKLVVAKI